MIVLGIETSCDETAVAIVQDGTTLLANVVFSSMDLHTVYGGVVPEIAARSHVEAMMPVIDEVLEQAFGTQTGSSEQGAGGRGEGVENEERRTKSDELANAVAQEKEINNKGLEVGADTVTQNSKLKTQNSSLDPWSKIDAIAVTYGAGLGGSLLVGVMTARTLAIVKDKPLYAINHVEAHVYANFLTGLKSESGVTDWESREAFDIVNQESGIRNKGELQGKTYSFPGKQPEFPMLALIVSGGHTQLVLFRGHFDYTLLGQKRDDAVGEAFDKVAKIIGLPYPGGPSVAAAAEKGNPYAYKLPKSRLEGESEALKTLRDKEKEIRNKGVTGSKEAVGTKISSLSSNVSPAASPSPNFQSPTPNYDFSFSGVKTAVLRLAQKEIGKDFTFPSFKIAAELTETQKNDIAASFQRTAIETLVDKAVLAHEEFQPKSIVIAGGVAANRELRAQLEERLGAAAKNDVSPAATKNLKLKTNNSPLLQHPDMKLCTDNGAMIATLGCYKAMLSQETADPYSLDIEPNLSM